MNFRLFGTVILIALTLPGLAFASPPEAEGAASLDADADADADANASTEPAAPTAKDRGDQPWIKRWAPEPHMTEIGVFGGALFPTPNHELFGPSIDLPDQGFRPLAPVAPEIGIRAGYYPLRFFGVEAEGAVIPARVEGGDSATLYTIRGQLIAQLGLWSITPFVTLGAGGLGVSSERSALGNDIDPSLHFGGGVKFYVNRWVMLRLDIRDVVTHKRGVSEVFNSHSPEVLLGLSFTLGRKKNEPRPQPVTEAPRSDRDGDGLWDDQDTCPDEAETVNDYQDEDGCPESDRDGDGFWDDQDACPDEPETANGYQDEDGCADEVPDDVKAFTGAIKGITFENNSDAIRQSSTKSLNKAVEVLTNNPDIRINITGHTDSKGDHDRNVDLSRRRAESVKRFLTEHGIDEGRITTQGLGPDQPADTNDTKAGRANNRRIEFEIIQKSR